MTGSGWTVERLVGSAADFHARPLAEPPTRAIWWFEVTAPALVLGSTQSADVVDHHAAERAGVQVVRRRSGGGAVLVARGAVTWVDVVLPADDGRWEPDIGRSFAWLGAAWAEVLDRLGRPGAEVHEGPLVRTAWSDLVCFAGLGPGEVRLEGSKVVGISQRRTRAAARFQCAVVHRWEPEAILAVLALSPSSRREAVEAITPWSAGIGAVAPEAMVATLADVLTDPNA